jgi:uncharacterized protein (TIGR00251 family)
MSPWYLKVRLTPRAGRNEVESWDGETLRVRVTAPPAEGQANEACRELLSKALDIPKSAIVLVQGAHSRDKVFRIEQGEPDIVGRFRRQ